MLTCTFFGHRDCDNEMKMSVYNCIEELICKNNVDTFYIGNQGNFDCIALDAVKKLQQKYNHIRYYVVFAYLPKKNMLLLDSEKTIYPCGIENVPLKFAISFRNKWMIENSDFVIGYIRYSFGGAYKFFDMAKKKGKNTINLYHE